MGAARRWCAACALRQEYMGKHTPACVRGQRAGVGGLGAGEGRGRGIWWSRRRSWGGNCEVFVFVVVVSNCSYKANIFCRGESVPPCSGPKRTRPLSWSVRATWQLAGAAGPMASLRAVVWFCMEEGSGWRRVRAMGWWQGGGSDGAGGLLGAWGDRGREPALRCGR